MNKALLILSLFCLLVGCGKDSPSRTSDDIIAGNWIVSRNNDFIERNQFFKSGLGQRNSINVRIIVGVTESFEGDFSWSYRNGSDLSLPQLSMSFIESGRTEVYEVEFSSDDLFVAYLLKPSGERASFRATYRRIGDKQKASDVISVN